MRPTEWRYCPECQAKLVQVTSEDGASHPACPDGHFTHYDNPAPTASAIIEQDSTYLALRRADPPKKGEWNLAGGFIKVGETAEEAMIREVGEETGLDVRPIKYLGSFTSVYGDTGIRTIGVVFLCRVVGGEFQRSKESSEHGWFTLDEFPAMAMADDQQAIDLLKRTA